MFCHLYFYTENALFNVFKRRSIDYIQFHSLVCIFHFDIFVYFGIMCDVDDDEHYIRLPLLHTPRF